MRASMLHVSMYPCACDKNKLFNEWNKYNKTNKNKIRYETLRSNI